MARFRVEDLLINVVGPGGWCGPALTRCIGVTLPNCGGVTLVGCQAVTLVGCEGQTLVGCGATLCGGNVTVCLGVSRCLGATLIAGCDAGCTLGTCSDACTWCSGECSKKATCEANKTTLVPSREEDLAELDALKRQLRSVLSEVETQERVLAEQAQLTNLEQVEHMEEQLSQALAAVQQQKDALRHSGAESSE